MGTSLTVTYRCMKPSPRAPRDPRDCGLWRHAKRNKHRRSGRVRVWGKAVGQLWVNLCCSNLLMRGACSAVVSSPEGSGALELVNVRFRKSHHERYFHQTTARTRCEGG